MIIGERLPALREEKKFSQGDSESINRGLTGHMPLGGVSSGGVLLLIEHGCGLRLCLINQPTQRL
jgi:hypothetical protein